MVLKRLKSSESIPNEPKRGPMKVLLIAGMPGAGKSEAVKVAEEMGVPVVRMGDLVREEVVSRGFDLNRTNLASVASAARKKLGADIWARRTLPRIPRAPLVVIDGCRSLEEANFFRRTLGRSIFIVGIHASPRSRWKRLRERARRDDPKTPEEFRERDRQELEWGLGDVIATADVMVVNEGRKGALRAQMRALLLGPISADVSLKTETTFIEVE
ncbi:MAG: AAA family ATPase [Thermoplasmata archaeon]